MADPPSIETEVLAHLNSLETSFNALITSVTTTPTYSAAPSASQSLIRADDSLTTALQALHTHQKNYWRILRLRSEANRLEDQIRSTIKTCIDLRKEIGSIHPSILSHSNDSDCEFDEEGGQRDVDYHTLLSFASKIGKHNAAAAKEAEEDSIRRIIKARKVETAPSSEPPKVNGSTNTMSPAVTAAPTTPATAANANATNGDPGTTSHNLIPQPEQDWLDAEAAMARARSGMAFPAAENLRRGMLGKLQWIREQGGGEEAVDREVRRMVGEAEGRPMLGQNEETGEGAAQSSETQRARDQQPGPGALPLPNRPPQQQAARPPPQHDEKKKSVVALDLDLWNEDDVDED